MRSSEMNGHQIRPENHLIVMLGVMTWLSGKNPGRQTKFDGFFVIVNVLRPSIDPRCPPPESLVITA